jgi:hypothetical protein
MSDAGIATIVSGAVTVATMVVGFLTLWVKVRYGFDRSEEAKNRIEGKVDATATTALEVNKKLNGGVDSSVKEAMRPMVDRLNDHANRINNLEQKMALLRESMDSLGKNVDSTRHEMRGHFQTIANNLAVMAVAGPKPVIPLAPKEEGGREGAPGGPVLVPAPVAGVRVAGVPPFLWRGE